MPSIVSRPMLMFADGTKIFHVTRNRDDYILQMVTTVAIENTSIFTSAQWTTINGHYYFSGILVDTVTSHSHLDILFDNQLKFHYHTTQVTTKANRVLGMINISLLKISTPSCYNTSIYYISLTYPGVQ